VSFTQYDCLVTRNARETSSTVISNNQSKHAACRTLFTDKSLSPVKKSNQINLIASL